MPRQTSTVLGPDGSPVVHHRAGPGPASDAIRHEATVLALAGCAGVVELVAAGDEAGGGAWLSTRYVAGGTLTDLLRSAGEPAATAALAGVAGALADLHERGIVHGRCTADHVVGGGTGASLCGFSAASVAGADRPVDALVDRRAFAALVSATLSSDAETSCRARRAVAGLTSPSSGTNLRAVAAELWALARDAGWVEPGHVLGRTGPRQGDRGGPERSTRGPLARRRPNLSQRDAAAGPSTDAPAPPEESAPRPGRPSSAWLPRPGAEPGGATDRGALRLPLVPGRQAARPEADELGAEPADDGALGRGDDGSLPIGGADRSTVARRPLRRQPRAWQPRRGRHAAARERSVTGGRGRLALAGVATAASLAVLGGIVLLGDRAPRPPHGASAAPSARPAPIPSRGDSSPVPPPPEGGSPAPTRVWPRPTEPAAPAGEVDLPGAGLESPLVEHDGARYAIGLPGDLVVLGDWDCDGTTTPAVVRPADGTVWSFPSWTTGPEVLAAEPVSLAAGAIGATTRAGTEGCDVLAITTAAGDEVVVHPATIERESGR